jgi:hypothetical protein
MGDAALSVISRQAGPSHHPPIVCRGARRFEPIPVALARSLSLDALIAACALTHPGCRVVLEDQNSPWRRWMPRRAMEYCRRIHVTSRCSSGLADAGGFRTIRRTLLLTSGEGQGECAPESNISMERGRCVITLATNCSVSAITEQLASLKLLVERAILMLLECNATEPQRS